MLFEPHKRVIPDKGITVLSLFNGTSCGRVALERAGIPVERYVSYEIEEAANAVAKYNYPSDEYLGDVFEGDFTQYQGFDLLIGGSPCTYWSIARGGADREVTCDGMGFKLFMQFVRALNESHCKYFLYENNSSISKDIQNEISKRLQVEPVEINSMEFSAQMRKRLYWTNIPFSKEYPHSDKVIKDIEYSCKHDIKSFEKYKDTIRFNKDNTIVSWDTSGKGNYSQQNRARYNTIKMNTLPSSGNDKNNIYLGGYSFRKIHPIEAERLQTLPDGFTECVKSASKRVELCGNGWTVDVIAWILKNLKSM